MSALTVTSEDFVYSCGQSMTVQQAGVLALTIFGFLACGYVG
jgi:hypothetical protein